jgi:hypothetical protein
MRIAIIIALACATLAPVAADNPADQFTAFAVNVDSTTPVPTGAGQVEIVINRYSPEADAARITTTVMEKGPEAVLEVVQKMPRIGYIRTPQSIGYDLRFARKVPGEDGGEQIAIMTDRYITFWEAANRPRTVDYPFTVIELRIDKDGEGEGKMSLFTKITADPRNRTLILENYGTQPVLLKNVRRTT